MAGSLEIDDLAKELELLDLYLSIEKVRFGARLNVTIDISPDALQCQVPNMLLQPLVENAIKYAIEPRKEVGQIIISAKCIAKRLILSVADDGFGAHDKCKEGFGIGICNTKARLAATYNGDYEITISDTSIKGVTVSLSLPSEKQL